MSQRNNHSRAGDAAGPGMARGSSVTIVVPQVDQATMNTVLGSIMGAEYRNSFQTELGADFVTRSHYCCTMWMTNDQITSLRGTVTPGTVVSVRNTDDASPKDAFRRLNLKRVGHALLGSVPNDDV